MKFVIIGGDAAGMSAASKAKRVDKYVDVVVLEKTFDVSYSACGMPYNIADPDRLIDDLIVRTPEVFREEQGIDLRLGHEVLRIDPKEKMIEGRLNDRDDFQIKYDKLLIATGARARKLTIPGHDAPGVLVLRSLQDGRRLKSYIEEHEVRSALIIGSGYIGLEMAEALHDRDIKVFLTDIRTELAPWMPHEMANLIKEELESKGAELLLGKEICELRSVDGSIEVIFRDSELKVDLVLVGVGVEPCSELASEAGLELGPYRSIAVDEYLHTSNPDIFAAGDCSDAFHAITGVRVWIPLALRANRAGWAAGENIFSDSVLLPGVLGTSVFKVMDYEVARTGFSLGEAAIAGFDPVEELIRSRSKAHGHPNNQFVYVHLVADRNSRRLLGANIVGKEGAAHRIDALAVALHTGMTVDAFFNCDLAYAPPFSPVWDPMLTAARQLQKKIAFPEKKPTFEDEKNLLLL